LIHIIPILRYSSERYKRSRQHSWQGASNIIIALNKWIDAWVYQERACQDAIENAEVTLNGFVSKVNAALRENPNGERAFPFWSDPPSLSQQCDFNTET
jgi:hypothetical protein